MRTMGRTVPSDNEGTQFSHRFLQFCFEVVCARALMEENWCFVGTLEEELEEVDEEDQQPSPRDRDDGEDDEDEEDDDGQILLSD